MENYLSNSDNNLNIEVHIPSFKIKEGYYDINIVDNIKFIQSSQTINEYIKSLIFLQFEKEPDILFLEERDEFKPTNYLKNSRHLKVFVVEDSFKRQHTFVFDVHSCLV